jgi:hypothetical protein
MQKRYTSFPRKRESSGVPFTNKVTGSPLSRGRQYLAHMSLFARNATLAVAGEQRLHAIPSSPAPIPFA